jgi:PST family polysaccharide transporter
MTESGPDAARLGFTQSSVLGKSVQGATYGVAVSAVTMVLGLVRSVLLMRFLGPDEFGYVSLALFFALLLAHLSTLGLDSALVQRTSLKPETLRTHLVMRIVLAVAIVLLLVALAPLLRSLYAGQTVAIDVLLVLTVANLVPASYSTPNALLQRELRFGSLAVINLLSSLAMTVGAPLLAFLGAGVWSLVFEQTIGYLIRWVGLWWIIRPWRIAVGFDRVEAKELLGFGLHALASQFLGIGLDRFDEFWAGTALGATALGIYSRAYEIAGYPARVLGMPVTRVFYSTFSALQDNRPELAKAVSLSSSFLVRAGFLIGIVLLVVIPEATLLLLGASWLPIVPVFRLMVVYVVLDPLYVNLGYLALGLGSPATLVRVRLGQLVLFVAAVVALARGWGIEGIAIAADLMMVAGVVALSVYCARSVRLELAHVLGWPVCALLVAAMVGLGLSTRVTWPSLWLAAMVKTVGVSLAFVLVLLLTERRALLWYGNWMWQTLRGSLPRLSTHPAGGKRERTVVQ